MFVNIISRYLYRIRHSNAKHLAIKVARKGKSILFKGPGGGRIEEKIYPPTFASEASRSFCACTLSCSLSALRVRIPSSFAFSSSFIAFNCSVAGLCSPVFVSVAAASANFSSLKVYIFSFNFNPMPLYRIVEGVGASKC